MANTVHPELLKQLESPGFARGDRGQQRVGPAHRPTSGPKDRAGRDRRARRPADRTFRARLRFRMTLSLVLGLDVGQKVVEQPSSLAGLA